MTSRTSTFQVRFTTDGSGQVKADIESVTKAAVDGSSQVNAEGGKNWEEYGRKIGTSLKWAGAAVGAGIALIVKNTIEAEQELAQLDAVLKSTGSAAGYTRDQLVAMAEGIAAASTFSSGEIVKAETRLLSYSGIASKNFPEALQIAIDQAARLGIGVEQSAETIGRALESPTKAAAALAQQGFGAAFTKSVRAAIKALEDAGDTAGAQKIVIDILKESYEGAAKAQRDTFGGSAIALKKTLNDLMTGKDGSLDGVTRSINDLNDTMSSPETKEAFASITSGIFSIGAEAAQAIVWLTKLNEQQMKTFGFSPGAKNGTREASGTDMFGGLASGLAALARGDWAGANAGADRAHAGAWGGRIADFSGVSSRAGLPPEILFSDAGTMPESMLLPPRQRGATGGDPTEKKTKQVKELTEAEKAQKQIEADLAVLEGVWNDARSDYANDQTKRARDAEDEAARMAQIADDMLQDIQLETEAMGMSSEQIEIRNNLLRAGVDAESDRGQAIIDATKQLQKSRETWENIEDLKDITTDFAASAIMDFGHAGDAAEEFGERLQRMAAELLAEKAIQWLFGAFGGAAGVAGAGGTTEFGGFGEGANGWIGVPKSGGGKIHGPGTPTSDSVAARLSRDEWVINADAASHYGDDMMADINAKRFAVGGPVSGKGAYGSAAAPGKMEVNIYGAEGGIERTEQRTEGDTNILDVFLKAAENHMVGSIGRNGPVGKAIGNRFGLSPVGQARG